MKKLILFFFLTSISLTVFSQSSLTAKEQKEIKKKLNLEIVNRGFTNESSIVVFSDGGWQSNAYKKLWEDALFDEGVELGTIKDNKTKSRWQLEIFNGGLSGRITDIEDNHNLVLKFTSSESMYLDSRNSKRSMKFKNYVKFIFSEIMKTTNN